MKITWNWLKKVIELLLSLPRNEYPFNFRHGLKEKHKADFLALLKKNGIDYEFDYDYVMTEIKKILVCSNENTSVAKDIVDLHVEKFGAKVAASY